jgi:hypothetical protein
MFVIRTETHYLIWFDQYHPNGFDVPMFRPTIGWVEDIEEATVMIRQQAEGRLKVFPPGSCRIARITRIEVES